MTPESLRRDLAFDAQGGLSLHGQPMILMPRHFFIGIMESVEALAGREAFVAIYRRAGFEGAVKFCRRFREVHRCSAADAVKGYLAEMSVRGWGQYRILAFDEQGPRLEVLLVSSALSHAAVDGGRHEVWVAAMEGAMAFLCESAGREVTLTAREVALGPEDPPGACRIHVEPQGA